MKLTLIFSGSNDRAVIAFCRYSRINSISIAIIANGEDDLIFLTDYKSEVIATRPKNVLTWNTLLKHLTFAKNKFSCQEIFILPTTEYINRFLLKNKLKLQQHQVTFGLCDLSLYAEISDKYAFGNLCNKYDILTPKEYSNEPDSYPFVIKPKKYATGHEINQKPTIIYNKKQLNDHLNTYDSNRCYFQEYIGGKSIYLLFHFAKNKSYSVFSQENYIQQHHGGSMILAKSSQYHLDSKLVQPYINLFQKENFHGLVMVEVKSYNGNYYMIEANPRLWGPSQLILDAQMTLFDEFCIDNELLNKPKSNFTNYINNKIYFWAGGLIKTLRNESELMFYDYNAQLFLNEYQECISSEIYLRDDTIYNYLKENS